MKSVPCVCTKLLVGAVLCSSLSYANAQINFTDSSDAAIGSFRSETWGAAIGDFNGDNWPDIWVSNHRERPMLYRNSGDGTFTNSILTLSGDEFFVTNRYLDQHTGAWADIDDDGDDDLLMQGNANGARTPSGLLISNGIDALEDNFEAAGLPTFGGRGIGWIDYDLDGDLDLFRSNLGPSSTPLIYRQTTPGQFSGSVRVPGCGGTNSILISDFNEDGTPNLVCIAEGLFPRAVFSLGQSDLESISADLSIPPVANVVDIASADFDNDLDPDLVFTRGTLQKNQALASDSRSIEALLDASDTQGEAGFTFTGGGLLTVTVYAAQSTFIERRGASAVETTRPRRESFTLDPNDPDVQGLATSRSGTAVYFGYDSATDQWDVVLTSTTRYRAHYVTIQSTEPTANLVTTGLRNVDGPIRPDYLRNDGAGNYSRQIVESNLPLVECIGLAAGDFDNDMDVDLYFVCQRGGENIGNRLFANDGTGQFTEVSSAGGATGPVGPSFFGDQGWGDNAAVADFDNDGYLDLFVTNGISVYPTRNRAGRHQVFMNDGGSANWIRFRLKGTNSDPMALGARVFVNAGGVAQMRDQDGGYHRWTQNDQRVHFGLASNSSATVSVRWPDGTTENFGALSANADYELVEGGRANLVAPGPVTPFPALSLGDECGTPGITPDLDRALFVYKDCASGRWRVRAVGGGDLEGSTFSGTLVSNAPLSGISRTGLEPADSVIGDQTLSFSLNTSESDVDEFGFDIPAGVTSACLSLDTPGNVPVMFGENYRRAETAVNLATMQPCTISVIPEVSVTATTVNESDGTVDIELTISSAPDSAVSVRVATVAGSATGGSDYFGRSAIVNFPAGQTTPQSFQVGLINDSVVEPQENFQLRLFQLNGVTVPQQFYDVFIDDDDTAGSSATLSVIPISVNEADGVANIEIAISGAPAQAVSATIATTSDTASGGTDFYGKSAIVNFSAGETASKFVSVTVLNDDVAEPQESFRIRLFNITNSSTSTVFTDITILDDD